MKKIVGIIAAVAMASSVFAVDFTAGMQLKADLFNYNGNTKEIQALQLRTENTKDDKPFIFSVNGDRAGATFKFYDNPAGYLNAKTVNEYTEAVATDPTAKLNDNSLNFLVANYWSIWFSPFANFKVELGNSDTKLNCETITWWKGKVLGAGDWGFKGSYSANGLTIAAALLNSRGNYWFTKADGADAAFGEIALYAQYDADFGTIKFLGDFTDKFDTMKFGLGYNGKSGAVSYFGDVAFTKGKAANGLAIDADAKYSQDGISAELYVQMKATDISKFGDTMAIPVFFKGSYALNGGSVYFTFLNDNIKAKKFDAELKLGYDGNMGALAYEVELNYKIASKTFSVPCYFRIGF